MNLIDRMELNELRATMWEIFTRIARTPENDREIEAFIRLMDRHQEVLAGDQAENGPEVQLDKDGLTPEAIFWNGNPIGVQLVLKMKDRAGITRQILTWNRAVANVNFFNEEGGKGE